jgi:hypothetical protein
MTPEHYDMEIQPITYIMANGLGFCEGNIIKYVSRYGLKGGIDDLRKAKHYIEILIKEWEKENQSDGFPSTEQWDKMVMEEQQNDLKRIEAMEQWRKDKLSKR